jgi:enolase-phosphatase E1
MTIHLAVSGIRAVLLDIEGTTTPIAFVHEVLFPYARARLAEYLVSQADSPAVADVLRRLAAEHAESVARGERPPPLLQQHAARWRDSTVDYAKWLMDRDRKSPGLKLLQGLIWERGYQAGELRGQVFADVPAAIRRWRDARLRVAIYSSGSELAQRRLFESTEHGNLAPLLSGFFDTAVGTKTSTASYARIAASLETEPATILFVSDVTAELDAATAAGLRVALSVRPGNAPQPANPYDVARSFDEIAV